MRGMRRARRARLGHPDLVVGHCERRYEPPRTAGCAACLTKPARTKCLSSLDTEDAGEFVWQRSDDPLLAASFARH